MCTGRWNSFGYTFSVTHKQPFLDLLKYRLPAPGLDPPLVSGLVGEFYFTTRHSVDVIDVVGV